MAASNCSPRIIADPGRTRTRRSSRSPSLLSNTAHGWIANRSIVGVGGWSPGVL